MPEPRQLRTVVGRPTPWLATLLLALSTLPHLAESTPRKITIAVARDGANLEQSLVEAIEEELPGHLPRNVSVRFDHSDAYDAGWDRDNARRAIEAALAKDSTDAVLAVGSLVGYAASRGASDGKPVLSTARQRPDFLRLGSGVEGVLMPRRVATEVSTFREIVPFSKLHLAVAAEHVGLLEATSADFFEAMERSGIALEVVGIRVDELEAALDSLQTAEAVLLADLPRLEQAQRRELLDGLNRAGVASFSLRGHADVELGSLASSTPPYDEQLARRLALNLARLIRGEPLDEVLNVDSRLLLNAQTAVTIDQLPSRELSVLAEMLHPEALESPEESLEFDRLMDLAESGSQALRVSDAEVEGVRQDQFIARSALRPQIASGISYTHLDTEQLGDDQGGFGSISLVQQLYDDGARSGARSARDLFESAASDRETIRLDVLAAAGQAYYNLALAKADLRVVVSDLGVTRDNLELARLRQEIGFSGRSEVIRFESVLAARRTSLFASAENVEAARIALNQILGEPQFRRFAPQIPHIDPQVFPPFDGRLDGIFDSLGPDDGTRKALVDFAIKRAPELTSLRSLIAAQKVQVDFLRRRFFVPRVFAEADYTEAFQAPSGPFVTTDDTWSISINVSYSLFEGGARSAELGRAKSELSALERTATLIEQRIEQRARTAVRQVEGSFPRIRFARRAAELARENLALVREQYRLGTVNVTDVLDAQNQQLSAEQFANAAIFEYLSDYVELQRAMSFFELEESQEERDAFVEYLLSTGNE
ncbi:MAG: TolC family protein [Acidobacteriota bacterium]